MSLRGMISSFGCCSRNSPLTWFKGQLSGSGWKIPDLLDRDRGSVGLLVDWDPGSRICWIQDQVDWRATATCKRGDWCRRGSILRVTVHCCFWKTEEKRTKFSRLSRQIWREKSLFCPVFGHFQVGAKMVFYILFNSVDEIFNFADSRNCKREKVGRVFWNYTMVCIAAVSLTRW